MNGRAWLLGASLAAIVACAGSAPRPETGAVHTEAERVPQTILMRGDRLAQSKRRLAAADAALKPTFDVLLDSANAALSAAPLSVMQKHNTPSSGDKHDYMSMAPYWWPDPAKPNGLPFIRRDGEIYPESRADHDGLRLQQTVARVQALALAYYLTGDARYSHGAARHLRVFFLDSATRMNPNLRFAQAVLGVTEGRGTGVIDTRDMPQLVDALRLLDGAPGWPASDAERMVAWSRAYLTWLLDSKNGREERAATNNHGTFYDEQVAALALFVGDTALARQTIGESGRARIAFQIDADGKQKQELERTRPLHYSLFNLDAFTMLAEMGRHVGVDLWHYTSPAGGSLERALLFLAPYADPSAKFPIAEIAEDGPDVYLPPMRRAAATLGGVPFGRAIEHVPLRTRARDFSRFNFPGQP